MIVIFEINFKVNKFTFIIIMILFDFDFFINFFARNFLIFMN